MTSMRPDKNANLRSSTLIMRPEIHQADGYKFMVGHHLDFDHKDTLEGKRFILSEFRPSASMSAD